MKTTGKKSLFPVKRLVLDAVLIALYIVLGFWRIPIGNMFRISVAPFVVILSALLFGPVDGLIVGFLGEFLTQILGPYGLTQTTLLWCLGETARGLTLGLFAWLMRKKLHISYDSPAIKHLIMLLTACVVTGILASFGNTLALYVDSKLFGYYSYYMVFGVLIMRIAIHSVVSALLGYICLPIIKALRKAKLV